MTRDKAVSELIHLYDVPLEAPESITTSDLLALCTAFEALYHALDELEDAQEYCARTHRDAEVEEHA